MQGLSPEEVELLRPVVGTIDHRAYDEPFHGDEYDLMIAAGEEFHYGTDEVPRRVIFAYPPDEDGAIAGRVRGMERYGAPTVAGTQLTPVRELALGDLTYFPGFASLIRESCVPPKNTPYRALPLSVMPHRTVSPLLQEVLSAPHALAAHVQGNTSEGNLEAVFWLPDQARKHLKEWVLKVMEFWRADEPELFPVDSEWLSGDDWASADEQLARSALRDHIEAEEERALLAAARHAELQTAVDAARASGDEWRHLVTASGEALASAVQGAFQLLGFTVVDADALPQRKGAKREDLRVSDGAWVALVEVKGYAGAAKSNDLMQITGSVPSYMMETAAPPDALWYVVNAYRNDDPSGRPNVLAGREDDIASFGGTHQGLVIDTRDLFALRQLVVAGSITAEEARATLRTATGRFTQAVQRPPASQGSAKGAVTKA